MPSLVDQRRTDSGVIDLVVPNPLHGRGDPPYHIRIFIGLRAVLRR